MLVFDVFVLISISAIKVVCVLFLIFFCMKTHTFLVWAHRFFSIGHRCICPKQMTMNKRMDMNTCLHCQTILVWQKTRIYHCQTCNVSFEKMVRCDQCETVVETLKACGATNYFCHTCNCLKSRSKVLCEFVELA